MDLTAGGHCIHNWSNAKVRLCGWLFSISSDHTQLHRTPSGFSCKHAAPGAEVNFSTVPATCRCSHATFKLFTFTLFPSLVSLLQEIISQESHEPAIQRSQEASTSRSSHTGTGCCSSTYSYLLSDHQTNLTKSSKKPISIRSQQGQLLGVAEAADELCQWFQAMYSDTSQCSDSPMPTTMDWPFSLWEIRKSFKQLSVYKAVSLHYAPAPYWRQLEQVFSHKLQEFGEHCVVPGCLPSEWGTALSPSSPSHPRRPTLLLI